MYESEFPVMAIILFEDFLIRGIKTFTSGVFPLLEINTTTSFSWIFPRSPWIASAACINIDGVPVELSVATILFPMIALLPIPVMMTLPFDSKIVFTATVNS